jgi:hypothetical protein
MPARTERPGVGLVLGCQGTRCSLTSIGGYPLPSESQVVTVASLFNMLTISAEFILFTPGFG